MGGYAMSLYSYCGKYIYIKPSMGAGWVGWVVMICQYIVTVANLYINLACLFVCLFVSNKRQNG